MIRSMTGFGEAETAVDDGALRLAVKSVNHRFLHTTVRLPHGNEHLDGPVTARVKAAVQRGHVSCTLVHDRDTGTSDVPLPELDVARVRAYRTAFETLAAEIGTEGLPDMAAWARLGDLFRPAGSGRTAARFEEEIVLPLVDAAMTRLVALRETEGGRLAADMRERLVAMGEWVDQVERLSPERLVRERDRLRDAVRELSEGTEVDEERLAREIAYLAEKWDIGEEVVRLRSHMALFEETLRNDADEAVGKRLGFVIQEMHREANTIGSKANDTDISRASVGLKEEIERLREQVENVE